MTTTEDGGDGAIDAAAACEGLATKIDGVDGGGGDNDAAGTAREWFALSTDERKQIYRCGDSKR